MLQPWHSLCLYHGSPESQPLEKALCFTGHRPEKLPHGGNESLPAILRLKSLLYKAIYDSIEEGYHHFYTGLAQGVDIWAADMVMQLMAERPSLRLTAVQPYPDFGKGRKGYEKWQLGHILEKCEEVITVCPSYTPNCMRLRNEYMVQHSHKLIAVVSDYKSGTGQTIRLAQKAGLALHIIDLEKNSAYFHVPD